MNRMETLLYTQAVRMTSHVKPDKKIWLFSSVGNSHYNYNSRYLFLYVKDHLPEIRPYFVINDPVLREKLKEEYGKEYFTNQDEMIRFFGWNVLAKSCAYMADMTDAYETHTVFSIKER